MKKVVIASKNPVKIQSVKNGFGMMFPEELFEFIGISVPSHVAEQPMGSHETFTGATNRVNNAAEEIKDADFYVGIEGGIEPAGDEMESFTWVVVKSAGRYGKAKTGTFFLPKEIVRLVKGGKDLGEAGDIVFKKENNKQKNGSIGLLTGDVIDRTKHYTNAVVLSLIPFKNEGMY